MFEANSRVDEYDSLKMIGSKSLLRRVHWSLTIMIDLMSGIHFLMCALKQFGTISCFWMRVERGHKSDIRKQPKTVTTDAAVYEKRKEERMMSTAGREQLTPK